MKILMVTHNNKEMLERVLHSIFINTDMNNNELIVCDNGSDYDVVDMLKNLRDKGFIDTLIESKNNSKRGSENHRDGLIKCLQVCDKNDKVVLMDCDCMPIVSGWNYPIKKLLISKDYIGIKHPLKEYLHPAFACGKAGDFLQILIDEKNSIVVGHMDCLESLKFDSKTMCELKRFKEDSLYITPNKCDPNVGEFYTLDNKRIVFHCWYYTRTSGYKIDIDELIGIQKEKLRKKILNINCSDVRVVIPVYGKTNLQDLEKVLVSLTTKQKMKATNVVVYVFSDNIPSDWARNIMCELDVEFIYINELYEMKKWSRGEAFNLAFAHDTYAHKYIFHDRDIVVPSDFIENIAKCDKPFFINYNQIMMHDLLEKNQVGGSVTVTWKAMMCCGGYCSDMYGWGGEDREFANRVCRLMQIAEHKLDMTVKHLDHETNDDKPEYNQKIKDQHLKWGKDRLVKCNYLFQDFLRCWSVKYQVNSLWDRRLPIFCIDVDKLIDKRKEILKKNRFHFIWGIAGSELIGKYGSDNNFIVEMDWLSAFGKFYDSINNYDRTEFGVIVEKYLYIINNEGEWKNYFVHRMLSLLTSDSLSMTMFFSSLYAQTKVDDKFSQKVVRYALQGYDISRTSFA